MRLQDSATLLLGLRVDLFVAYFSMCRLISDALHCNCSAASLSYSNPHESTSRTCSQVSPPPACIRCIFTFVITASINPPPRQFDITVNQVCDAPIKAILCE